MVSLGQARPSEGYCHSWWGIKIDKGEYGGETLDGLLAGILLDVPGRMGEGDWKVACSLMNAPATPPLKNWGNFLPVKAAALWGSWPFSSEKLSDGKGGA